MKLIVFTVVIILLNEVSSFPQYYRRGENRDPRTPQRAMMLSSYYGPPYRRYVPQTAMTAFASGSDTIATGTYNGEAERPSAPTPDVWAIPPEEDANKNEVHTPKPDPEIATELPVEDADEEEIEEEQSPTTVATTSTTRKAKGIPKRKRKPQIPIEEDEEEEEQDSWPFGGSRRGGMPNFTFFPIMFGSSFGRSTDGSPSGAATAIANSFSTGKGGVASSHATAFGDPETYRSWKRNLKRKTPSPEDKE